MTIETPDLIDALPLVDTELDTDASLRQLVVKLVANEAAASAVQPNDVTQPDRPFLTDRLRSGFNRLESNQPLRDVLHSDMINPNTPLQPISDSSSDDLDSYKRCLDQVKIKLEYKQRQMINLEILKAYGKPAWEQSMTKCEKMLSKLDEELESIDARIRYVNAERKSSQEQISRRLDVLQTNWDNLSIRNQMLAEEIDRLRSEIAARTRHD